MGEGKSAGFSPSLLRGHYAVCGGLGRGIGLGNGSDPSATSTPVFMDLQPADSGFACFVVRVCTTVGKTATAANKTNVTRVPRTLSFDIFISLKKLARTGAADTSTILDPAQRVGGKWDSSNFG